MRVKKKITVGKSAKKKVKDKADALKFSSLFPKFLTKYSNTAYTETSLFPGILSAAVFLYSQRMGLSNFEFKNLILVQKMVLTFLIN
jgi:hypothetical protein